MMLIKHKIDSNYKLFRSRYHSVFMPAKVELERLVLEVTKPFYDMISTDVTHLTTYNGICGFFRRCSGTLTL